MPVGLYRAVDKRGADLKLRIRVPIEPPHEVVVLLIERVLSGVQHSLCRRPGNNADQVRDLMLDEELGSVAGKEPEPVLQNRTANAHCRSYLTRIILAPRILEILELS